MAIIRWQLTGEGPEGQLADAAHGMALVSEAIRFDATGPLLAAHEAGLVQMDRQAIDSLVAEHRRRLSWCLRLEQRLLAVSRWFDDVGITYLVVKGPAIAHLDEVDPANRTFVDIDLLIQAGDLERALQVLAERGAVRPYLERRPGFDLSLIHI